MKNSENLRKSLTSSRLLQIMGAKIIPYERAIRMKRTKTLLALLLAAALLAGCGTAAETEPTPPPPAENAVVVTTVAELLDALRPNAVIEIDAEHLLLDRAGDYGFGYSVGAYTWEPMGSGDYTLVIRDLEGLTIRSRREGGTSLTTGAASANVLCFRGCAGLTLEGLTLGHRSEVGNCDGDVLFLQDCSDIQISGCELFGCGVTAVNAWQCAGLRLDGCTLRDCTACAINAVLCSDVQAWNCEILRCGGAYSLGALCVASCDGFALINSTIRDGKNSFLLDAMNSLSVCLLGCEATGSRFSEALFRICDYTVTVSGCALADNEFGSCYSDGGCRAVTGSDQELVTFADFLRMEHKPFTGEYVAPSPRVTPGDIYTTSGDIAYASPGDVLMPPPAAPEWEGERTEAHVMTVDELLAAIAPHTTVYLDAEEFDLSAASDYGSGQGEYYRWNDAYDGPELVLHDLDDFSLVGGGRAVTLLSAVPRYADVLHFENCRALSLSDMTLGHRVEPGFCAGDVLGLSLCTGVTVERCGLFGCGVIGISADTCAELNVSETNIYDCSYLGVSLENVSGARFTGCAITNCGGEYGFNGLFLDGCSDVFWNDESLRDGDTLLAD